MTGLSPVEVRLTVLSFEANLAACGHQGAHYGDFAARSGAYVVSNTTATVLILCPTFDHAETLFASTASVRAQTFRDWELVVIGDGAPERTREIMSAVTRCDGRIRYVAHPKSQRYGESYRDRVIRDSRADVVLQLGDDDLWAPDHVERMLELVHDADWANQAPLRVAAEGGAEWWPINHGTGQVRASIVRGVPVSAGPNYVVYRRTAYLRLPEGWTCAPPTGPSDAFMWAKFFRLPGLAVASSAVTTAIKFPAQIGRRATFDSSERLAELQPWLARIAEPGFVRNLCREASVRARMLSLYQLHAVPVTVSWAEALRHCGFEPLGEDEPATIARNGEPMPLPLSPCQSEEAAVAWEDYGRMQAS